MNEEMIRQSSRIGDGLMSTLLDLLPDYFYVADADMRLMYVNKTAADYFGLPKNQIVGKRFPDVEPDTDFAKRFNDRVPAVAEPSTVDTA